MGWTGVITNAGRTLFATYATSGLTLSIDTVKAGSGSYSDETAMKAATALNSLKDAGMGYTTDSMTLVEKKTALSDGIQFRMRIGASPSAVGTYTLTEIGLFVNATDGTSTTSTMVAYYQTDNGVDIPLQSSFPDFAFILSSVLAIDNTTPISLTVDGSAYISSTDFDATVAELEESIAEKLDGNLGSGSAGYFLTVGSDGTVTPVSLDMEGATSQSAGTSGLVPAPSVGDEGKYLMGNGTWGTIAIMTGATGSAAGTSGFVPAPGSTDNGKYLRGDGTWATPANTTYSAGTGLSLDSTTFSLGTSGVTAGSYGPTANVTGSNNATINVPQITVDTYGRVTGVTNRVYTSVDTNTTYSAGTGLSLSSGSFSLATSGVSAGSYGPTGNVTGSNNATINVPQITVDAYGRVTSVTNRVYTSVNTDTNTTYSAGTGLSLSGTSFSLGTSGVTAGSYGPSANVSGTNGTTINVPQITVDKYGRVTGVTNRVYTSVNTDTNTTYSAGNGLSLSGTTFTMSGSYTGDFTATRVFNAVWNDYAECREAETVEGGYCVTECEGGIMKKTTGRLQSGCKMTSDTYGSLMGQTSSARTPIAVAGRVLAYTYRDRLDYPLGAALCSGPDGTVDLMTREEIREYPERIIGTVSEIPNYEVWNAGTEGDPHPIPVNGRIWIYVR